jgi:hypothetical protein
LWSADKRLGGKTAYDDAWLRAILGEVSWSRARRCGKHEAIDAICHSLLVVISHRLCHRRPD